MLLAKQVHGLKSLHTEKGQATVEAAFAIPVLFILLLVLLQPGIVLYDHMVMNSAAAEGCRLLATRSEASGLSDERCVDLIKRQLAAIPPHPLFHMHAPHCSWDIRISGSDSSEEVSVEISHRLRLLPLFDISGVLAGIADSEGCIQLEAAQSAPTQPAWAHEGSAGLDPESWVNARKGSS